MGCANSNAIGHAIDGKSSICWKEEREEGVTRTLTSLNYNETEVDISHFSRPTEALGIGGFGMVRLVKKLTGSDRGQEYALKSMSKQAILKRSSGPSAVSSELKCLIILCNCNFVCRLHYAFQNESHLFMVLELGLGGDLRYNLRATPKSRFSETTAKNLICQILIALDHCHKSFILHRGRQTIECC